MPPFWPYSSSSNQLPCTFILDRPSPSRPRSSSCLRPSGLQSSAVMQWFSPPLLSTWPSQYSTSYAVLHNSRCVNIHRKHCYWKVSSFLSPAFTFMIFQVSQPYSRTGLNNVLKRHVLVLPIPLAVTTPFLVFGMHFVPSAFCSWYLYCLHLPCLLLGSEVKTHLYILHLFTIQI